MVEEQQRTSPARTPRSTSSPAASTTRPHANVVVRPEIRYDWTPPRQVNNASGTNYNQWSFGIDAVVHVLVHEQFARFEKTRVGDGYDSRSRVSQHRASLHRGPPQQGGPRFFCATYGVGTLLRLEAVPCVPVASRKRVPTPSRVASQSPIAPLRWGRECTCQYTAHVSEPPMSTDTQSTEPSSTPRWQPLEAIERRVLGVLVEKAKTTPENYPLSLNALAHRLQPKEQPRAADAVGRGPSRRSAGASCDRPARWPRFKAAAGSTSIATWRTSGWAWKRSSWR